MAKQNIQNLPMLGTNGKKRDIPVFLAQRTRLCVWGRGTPIFMKTIKFVRTHDPHRASRRGHVGGRAIRRDRAQADVPRSRPLISPCTLLYFIYEASPRCLRAAGVGFCRSRALSQFAVDGRNIYDEYSETRNASIRLIG